MVRPIVFSRPASPAQLTTAATVNKCEVRAPTATHALPDFFYSALDSMLASMNSASWRSRTPRESQSDATQLLNGHDACSYTAAITSPSSSSRSTMFRSFEEQGWSG
jgi:hypothetical protein